jgi:ribosomal protein S3AE
MDLIHDKMCSMVKKWQTMTEAPVDVKTASGYLLHPCWVGFTKMQQQSDMQDHMRSAPTGLPNLEDDGTHNPREADK